MTQEDALSIQVRKLHTAVTAMQKSAEHQSHTADILVRAIGIPSNGAEKATGLHARLDQVEDRIKPFEKFHQQATGGMKVLTYVIPPFVIVLWFLVSAKLKHFFGY